MNAAERKAATSRQLFDLYGGEWIYDCGWRLAGSHPYRHEKFGFQFLDQPVGLKDFFREYAESVALDGLKLREEEA